MITIMKASAGSGKTFNLAKTYIRLLLQSKEAFAYRHILAVTFTNKATDEMKKRILDELHTLALNPVQSGYYKDFVPALFPTAEALKAKSHTMLTQILHDYSAFSVSTIDRFFQMAIKAFAREIGQFSTYQIELDKKSLIREAADRLLDNIRTEDKPLLEWMEDGMNASFVEGKSFDFNNKLYDIADLAKSEELDRELEIRGLSAETAFSQERLSKTIDICEKVIADWKKQLKAIKLKIREILKSSGLSEGDFFRSWIKKVTEDGFDAPTETVHSHCYNTDGWFKKADAEKNMALVAGTGLEQSLMEYAALFEEAQYSIYCTALTIKDSAHDLFLASDLRRQFEEILKEKNVLSIDDTNSILRDIISDSDTPFIYEKLGVRFENFLLDEFQDTSAVQWDNFKPLLAESNASRYENLIVGDVKQSIYRWRGSDWELLANKVKTEFPDSEEKSLDENWRSCKNIVEFNNAFYKFASEKINGKFGSSLDIYSDVQQKARLSDSQDGFVKVNFTDKENTYTLIKESIQEALDAHAKPSDIAILVRRNSVGADIADFLIKEGFQVVSNDSLMDEASATVRKLMSLLCAKCNPEDGLNTYLSSSLGIDIKSSHHNLLDTCEYFLRELQDLDPDGFKGEIPYIESFMDELRNWTSKYGNDLIGFVKHWKEDNDNFKLSSPEDEDAITIITSHKSKGLEYPYVIMPFANDNGRGKGSSSNFHWTYLDLSKSALKDVPENIYPLKFDSALKNTVAKALVEKEEYLNWIDYLNTFYVSTTRACKGLHIIAENEPGKDFKYVSDYLRLWLGADEWSVGEMYDFSKMKRKRETSLPFSTEYPSFPLNPDSENPRLRVSEEAGDFFADDGAVGVTASPRRRGVVLHEILSKIGSDGQGLSKLVEAAKANGELSDTEAKEVSDLLHSRLSSASKRGWFSPASKVRNEVEIFDTDGTSKRPDRVEIHPDGSVLIIDFKFGEDRARYHTQVERYMELYRRMGYGTVKGCLWFVDTDEVSEIV